MRKEVQNLEAPVNLENYLSLPKYIGILKDYVEALQENDFETL